jgi:glycosyltransferase involved in cell wall biosynthesis
MRSQRMTDRKLLFIWNYHYFPFEKGKSRFSDLLDAFVKEGYQVEVVTSSFYHMGKTQRSIEDPKYQSLGYKVHFISEPGYKKNVSFARVRSMNRFNVGVRAYLKKHDSVDVVYVPVPSIKLAAIAEKWCHITKAKCVIDVEDLWPESFQMIIRPKFLYKAATWPLMVQANHVYREADAVVAVSQTYMNRIKKTRDDSFPNAVAPIGADLDYVRSIVKKGPSLKPKNEFWVMYVGTFGKSYDLKVVIDAVTALKKEGYETLRLKLLGSGPAEKELREYSKSLDAPVDFVGLMPYDKMCQMLSAGDVAVNPIVKNSVASLINKVADYAACGIPVINSQQCEEYVSMIRSTQSGVSIPPGNSYLYKEVLKRLLSDRPSLELMQKNTVLLAHLLSRAESQSRILSLLSRLLK